ncbi:hypothetical protein C2857_004181 [Epichloe festucae Fl1]|uniref:Copper acquisition factor BIM1-like domain-containing protein n=1 Tax=Epichloe festucae (strain Fl1) TaxID=877507 RepID=A0A7S9KP22_EPIFF|nr:hypothetical protein C2857_004181 [Epichloe festucae Fl1]
MAVGVLAGHPTSNHMGPAAFMWPPDRVWSAAADNTAPCGSVDSVRNRTNFPMTGGKISLVDQKEASGVQLSISYKDNPDSDHDFTTLIKPDELAQLKKGHKCVPVKDAPLSVKPGANATLQIKYTASFDKPENETFYACADITYVELPNFKENIACYDIEPDTGSETKTGSASMVNPALDSSKKESSGGSGGLSGGAIAGVVVGVVAGVSMLAAGLIIYRRKQQRLRILRQQNSPRNVKWDERPRDSNSTKSVRLQNLS